MSRIKHSIASKLSLYLILSILFLFLACIAIIGTTTRRTIMETALSNVENVLNTMIEDIEGILTETETAAENMIWLAKDHMNDPDYMFHLTENLVRQNKNIVGSTVAFEPYFYKSKGEYYAPYSYKDAQSGEIKSFQMGNNNYDYFTMDWYQIPLLKKQNLWCEPYFDEGGGNQMMTTYSVPLWNDDSQEVFAVLTADISLSKLTDKITEIKPYNNSYTFLIGNSGSYISHPDQSYILNETIFTTAEKTGNKQIFNLGMELIGKKYGMMSFKTDRHETKLCFYGALTNGWSVCLVCPKKEILGILGPVTMLIILITALGMYFIYLVSRKIISRTIQPITEFTYTAMNIAKGNFKARIPDIKSDDEIGRLHDSLSYMLSSVNSYINQLKISTATNERFESELNIASNIQMHMLPTEFPDSQDFDLYALLRPAKEVGGDLYDFFQKGKYLYFTVGDVSGKGVPAALYMAMTRTMYRYISNHNPDIADNMTKINDAVSNGNTTNMFVTLFTGRINLETLEMEYCNAGHNPIILIDPDGKAGYIHAKANIAAGLLEGFSFNGESIQLQKGSRLLIYTDGVSEAENVRKELYGEDRLLEFCNTESASESSEQFINNLLMNVKKFTAENDQNDDITIMSIKVG